jgi:adenylate kinase family enzyme
VSTGDMLREAVHDDTEIGRRVKTTMERGELVPDSLVLQMIAERIERPDCSHGFVFDGFPRTVAQAKYLGELLKHHGYKRPFVIHLVIDPSVTFSTYFGGTQQETGRAIAVTPAGDIAVVGSSYSPDFPTLNPVRPTYSGIKQDLVVLRINAAGSLVYSTYLGGNGDDNPRDIVFDTAGDVYATGYGNSHDLPTMNPIQAASGGGGDDDYLFELSPTGALMYGTYLGGKGKDGKPQIALGSDNSIYLAGYSTGYFPVTAGAFQPTMHGTVDFTVTKLAPGAHSIVYSTYYGGTVNDTPRGVRVDALGNAYTTGWSESADFPVTPGAYQTTFGGDRDGTLTKFDPSGQPVWSTYIGGSGKDGPYQGDSIAIDATGLGAIEDLADQLHASGRSLLLCGAREQPAQLMTQAEFERHVGAAPRIPRRKSGRFGPISFDDEPQLSRRRSGSRRSRRRRRRLRAACQERRGGQSKQGSNGKAEHAAIISRRVGS